MFEIGYQPDNKYDMPKTSLNNDLEWAKRI